MKQAIASTNAIAYTAQAAQQEVEKAISALTNLPPSPYLDALHGLAHFAINRSH